MTEPTLGHSGSDDTEARRLVDTIIDANNGWPELRKTHPELVAEFERRQREVARKVHRTPPESIRHMRF